MDNVLHEHDFRRERVLKLYSFPYLEDHFCFFAFLKRLICMCFVYGMSSRSVRNI